MSWFDTSGFSSFAKSALNQAQKSIDRVLDIEDGSSERTERSSASSSLSGTSNKESSIAKKSSSISSTSRLTRSSRNFTSPDISNSNDDTSEGNTFWSSFLGESVPSNKATTELKGSVRRPGARKLGSRVGGTAAAGKLLSSKGDKESVRKDATPVEKSSTVENPGAFNQGKELATEENKLLQAQSQPKSTNMIFCQDPEGPASVSSGSQIHSSVEITHIPASGNKKQTAIIEAKSISCENQECKVAQSNSRDLSLSSKQFVSSKSSVDVNLLDEENVSLPSNNLISEMSNLHIMFEGENVALEQDAPFDKSSEVSEEKENSNENTGSGGNLETIDSKSQISGGLHKEVGHTAEPLKDTDTNSFATKQPDQETCFDGSEVLGDNVASSHDGGLSDGSPIGSGKMETQQDSRQCKSSGESDTLLDGRPLACSTPYNTKKGTPVLNQGRESCLTDHRRENEGSVLVEAEHLHPYNSDQPQSLDPAEGLLGYEATDSCTKLCDQQEEIKGNALRKTDSLDESPEGPATDVGMGHTDDIMSQKGHIEDEGTTDLSTDVKDIPVDVSLLKSATYTENADDLSRQIEQLKNEVTTLRQVVEVREAKLVHLSKENIDLQEATSILRNQLEQAEAALKAEDEDVDEVRQEFTVRVSAAEKKYRAMAKERDEMKALLEQTEQTLNSRNDRQTEEFTTLLKEKDDQIAQLLEEGEKLSKQQLQSNNIIKKLRAKEKESDALIAKNSKTLEEMKTENTRLTEILQVKEETERKQGEAITKLNAYVQKQEEQFNKHKSELEDAAEKTRSMQTALDNAYKQLADLHKANASKESVAQEAALSAEMKAKEELRLALEKKERQFHRENENLELQINDLQTSLRRTEHQAARREDNLRQEVSDLQKRLQEAEARNQELTESVTHATRPLLRQIENLQSSYGNQTLTWERVEKSLTERLNDAQMQLVEAQEKERVATEHALELTSRLASMDAQLATYRQDKSRLEAALEVERARLETAEEAKSRETARLETLQNKFRKMVEDFNVEKALLEQQLAVERGKMETERKKLQNAMDEKERRLLRQTSLTKVPSSPTTREDILQDEIPEASPNRTIVRQTSSGGSSVVDGMTRGLVVGAATALVERLQAQVRQKDGEIEVLQEQIIALEKTRDSVTEELTNLTSRLETTEEDIRLLGELKTRYKALEQRHNAVLQMYGEKAEEAEELMMDLEDVKSMYKSQIQELLGTSR